MAQILPFSAILCHFLTFCKETLYLSRQPLCFHHFARRWPLTSRGPGAGLSEPRATGSKMGLGSRRQPPAAGGLRSKSLQGGLLGPVWPALALGAILKTPRSALSICSSVGKNSLIEERVYPLGAGD